jgi:hypothetical protein
MTSYDRKLVILNEFYLAYRYDEELQEFFETNDLGAPLAYLASEGLCELTDDGKKYLEQTWGALLTFLGIEDSDFKNLEQVLLEAGIEE